MKLLSLFTKKKIAPDQTETCDVPSTPQEEKRQFTQVNFPSGIVIAEETVLVIPELINAEYPYPAFIIDTMHEIPPTVIGIQIPIKDLLLREEKKVIKKAAQYDFRIAAVLSEELPNLDEFGRQIDDSDYNQSCRLYLRPINDIKQYNPRDESAKIYFINKEDIHKQLAVCKGRK